MMVGNGGAVDGEVGITSGGRSFTGVPVGESKLASFIQNLKKLNIGDSTRDDISSATGKPGHVSKQGGEEEWKYNFLVTEDSQAAEFDKATLAKLKINEKIKEVERAGGDSMHLNSLYFKAMEVQAEIMKKLNTQATCVMRIGKDGKLSSAKVEKFRGGDSEVLYVKGDAESAPGGSGESGLLPTIDVAPSNPKPGQTYLNTTDSHFYGWNGKEWKQLDQ
jgi:hypothetical protein